jgi:phosphotransferase system IIB component
MTFEPHQKERFVADLYILIKEIVDMVETNKNIIKIFACLYKLHSRFQHESQVKLIATPGVDHKTIKAKVEALLQ